MGESMKLGMRSEKGYVLNLINALTVFAMIDICMFPYIRRLHCTVSMLLLLIWYATRMVRIRMDKEVKAFFITLICVFVSICCTAIFMPKVLYYAVLGETRPLSYTITYSIIYVFMFLYYFFFREMAKNRIDLMYKTLKVIYICIFLFAVVYMLNTTFFYHLRSFWSMSGARQEASITTSTYYRYTFSFSDPNNAAAATIAICILLMENKKEKKFSKYIYFFMCLLVIVASMSVQSVLALALYMAIKAVYLLYDAVKGKIKINFTSVALACMFLFAALVIMDIAMRNPVVTKSLSRIGDNDDSFQTRLEIWGRLLSEKSLLYYLICGTGCAIAIGTQQVMPHNGHLYLIYSYGLVTYIAFLYVFFWKKSKNWRDMFFLIPLFICFTINVGLIDARYSFAVAAIVAIGWELKTQANKEEEIA